MEFALEQLSQSTTPILSLTEVKAHLRIDDTYSDTYLTSLVERATQLIEWETNVDLRPTQWLMKTHFPRTNRTLPFYAPHYRHEMSDYWLYHRRKLIIPRSPLQQNVTGVYAPTGFVYPDSSTFASYTGSYALQINYFDYADVWQTWTNDNYAVLAGRKTLAEITASTFYPGTYCYKQDSVWVTFSSGWTSPPEIAKQAALLLIGGWYENRESPSEVNLKDYSTGFDRLLDQIAIVPQA